MGIVKVKSLCAFVIVSLRTSRAWRCGFSVSSTLNVSPCVSADRRMCQVSYVITFLINMRTTLNGMCVCWVYICLDQSRANIIYSMLCANRKAKPVSSTQLTGQVHRLTMLRRQTVFKWSHTPHEGVQLCASERMRRERAVELMQRCMQMHNAVVPYTHTHTPTWRFYPLARAHHMQVQLDDGRASCVCSTI